MWRTPPFFHISTITHLISTPLKHIRMEEHKPVIENVIPINRLTTHPQATTLGTIITIISYTSPTTQTGTTLEKVFDTLRSTNSYRTIQLRSKLPWPLRTRQNTKLIFILNSHIRRPINTTILQRIMMPNHALHPQPAP